MSETPADSTARTHFERPIFIVGAMRSGTTLIRLMLNRHSTISIPPESHFLSSLFARFGPTGKLATDEVDEAVRIVITSEEWQRDWQSDPDSLSAAAAQHTPMDVATFIDCVFREEVRSTGKPQWGSKTPAHLFQVPRLRACFPGARFLAMVRDPRDAFLSLSPRNWVGSSTWQVGSYLHKCDRLVKRFADDRVGQFMTVRYEDLVLSPEQTLRDICAFLEIDFEPSMLTFHEDAQQNVQQWEIDIGAHNKLLRPPAANDVHRWKREGSSREMREVEALTAEAISWFDYEPTLGPLEARLLRSRARARHHARNPSCAIRSLRSKMSPTRPPERPR